MKTTLHFVRHADAVPEPDAQLDASTGYDVLGLSVKGNAQAEALARRLVATADLAAVYSSPTRRAHETAGAVARAAGLDVLTDARLREVYLGEDRLENVPPAARADAVRERLTLMATVALRDGGWAAVPGVEPAADVRSRMTSAVAEIVARHQGRQVAVVSHAGSINAYLAQMLGIPSDFFYPIGNTSLNSVRFTGGRPLLLRLNDTAHLEREGPSPFGTERVHRKSLPD
jgi:probable phosphoglycerate mutase